MTKVQSKNAILFDIENDAGPLRDAMVATIGEGTTVDPGLLSAADKAKLDGIASAATANATDASLRDRTTHTGEQAMSTITGLVSALAGKATPADIASALAGLVDSSPATLDTLNELAAALGDDPAFATTVSTALGNRLRVDAAQGLTGPQQAQGRGNLGLGSAALAASGDFATAAQGAKADTALPSEDHGVFDTEALASAATIGAGVHAVRLNGSVTLGDGFGGIYIDTNNGATDTFTSNGGTRTWYRATFDLPTIASGDGGKVIAAKPTEDGYVLTSITDSGAVQKSGDTMSGVLTWDNGTDPTIPTMTAAGAFDLNIGGTSHFKIWPDLDGDGDYDADIWSKDNMYVVAESAIHLRPGYVEGQPEAGRLRIWAENQTNYIQSGRDFSGATENDLVISKYESSFAWTMYDVSQNGYAGFGYSLGDTVPARLSAKDGSATVGYFENTSTAIARIAFKGSTTAGATSVTVGASGDDLVLRGAGSDIVRVNTTGVYPMTDNNRILGSSSFRWSTVYAGTGTINTSDATTKRWLGPIPEAVRRAMMRVANGVGHFQFLDAIAAKGDGARKHIGVTAQNVIAAFEAEGLDPWEWAPICRDPVISTTIKTRKATREVLRQVERTRIVRKKLMETVAVPVERVEILDGLPVLVATTKDELRPVVDMLPLHDEQGNIVTKTTADGSSEPVLVAVPRTYEAEETYIEEVTDTEEFDEEYEVTEETGKTILGVRHDELMWGIVATMLSWQQKWTDLPLKNA